MKQWPDKNEMVDVEKLLTPVRHSLGRAYRLTRINQGADIAYEGYDIGKELRVTSLSPKQALTAVELEWSESQHGRDALDTILLIAFQLGVEQGQRFEREKVEEKLDLLHLILNSNSYEEQLAKVKKLAELTAEGAKE